MLSLMFERYTVNARRVLFFGRYEASQFGTSIIESEHLLLGLIREDRTTSAPLLSVDAGLGGVEYKLGRRHSGKT